MDNKTYFIRSSMMWSDHWGEITMEKGMICYVKPPHLKKCYELLVEKTVEKIRNGYDLLVTIGYEHGDHLCDIVYTTLKCYHVFNDTNLTVIDKDVNFSNFTDGMEELTFDGTSFTPYDPDANANADSD